MESRRASSPPAPASPLSPSAVVALAAAAPLLPAAFCSSDRRLTSPDWPRLCPPLIETQALVARARFVSRTCCLPSLSLCLPVSAGGGTAVLFTLSNLSPLFSIAGGSGWFFGAAAASSMSSAAGNLLWGMGGIGMPRCSLNPTLGFLSSSGQPWCLRRYADEEMSDGEGIGCSFSLQGWKNE